VPGRQPDGATDALRGLVNSWTVTQPRRMGQALDNAGAQVAAQ